MTIPIVPTVTDELIAQLAALANADPQGAFPIRSVVIMALLAERATLKLQLAAASVDAERYQWLIENADMMHWENMLRFADLDGPESVGQFIDAARNASSD